jgi:hypothetical protein
VLDRICDRFESTQVRMVGKSFRFVIPGHVMTSLFLLQLSAKSMREARVLEWLLPAVACVFIFSSIPRQMKNFLVSGLVFLAVGVYRLQQEVFPDRAFWPVLLLMCGLGLMVAAANYAALRVAATFEKNTEKPIPGAILGFRCRCCLLEAIVMKRTSMLPALAGFLILAGCDTPTPSVLSLEPVATDQELVAADGLTGTWLAGEETCVIRRDKDNAGGYEILYLSGGSPAGFDGRVFRVGEAVLMEVTPGSNDNDFRVPGHALARIWVNGAELKWAFLDSDWLKQQASQLLAHHQADNKMLLLATGPAVHSFLNKYGADDKAYGKITTWQRLQ